MQELVWIEAAADLAAAADIVVAVEVVVAAASFCVERKRGSALTRSCL
jgi:hypothetical protein